MPANSNTVFVLHFLLKLIGKCAFGIGVLSVLIVDEDYLENRISQYESESWPTTKSDTALLLSYERKVLQMIVITNWEKETDIINTNF